MVVEIVAIIKSWAGKKALDVLLDKMKCKDSDLEKAYRKAFDKTTEWYEETYGNKYGPRWNRFYDYKVTEKELARLMLVHGEPDLNLIKKIPLEKGKKAPLKIIQAFELKLREEMKQIRECEAVLAEREKFLNISQIAEDTGEIKNHTKKIVNILDERLPPPEKDNLTQKTKALDWRILKDAFVQRELDKIPIKHVGEGLSGPALLDLREVFFHQDAGFHSIEIDQSILRGIKDSDALKKIFKQSEIWQAHLWRFDQEHREAAQKFNRYDEDKRQELLQKIATVLQKESSTRNGVMDVEQFNETVVQLTQKLGCETEEVFAILHWLFESNLKREPVLNHLKAPCSALLIGDAGVGKSTVVRRLTLDMFDHLQKDQTAPVPVFVRLDQIATVMKEKQPLDQATQTLFKYISVHWAEDLNCAEDLTEDCLRNCPAPLQIILDGLDEIPSEKLRLKLATVTRHLSQSEKHHFIITSRPTAVTESLLNNLDFPTIRLLELTEKQVKDFVSQFLEFYNDKDKTAATADATAFNDALELSEAAREFSGNPLYLTVMILMHKKHKVLPEKRLQLFSEFYKMLFIQRSANQDKGKMADKPVFKVTIPEGDPIIWWEDIYTPLLQKIARLTHENNEDSVSIGTNRVIRAIEKQGLTADIKGTTQENIARHFLDFADEKLGVLVSRGPFWGFSHRSLQEYLAAQDLAKFDESHEIKDFWESTAMKKPDRWIEVTRLLFCEIRQSRFLFPYLTEQWVRNIADTKEPRVIEMIAKIISDLQGYYKGAGTMRPLYESVKAALKNRRNNSYNQPQQFLAVTDALGRMHEPAIDVTNPPMIFFEPKESFMMDTEDGRDDEKPVHPVKLSPFWLGKYPVTNLEFAEFMKQGGYEDERYWYDTETRFQFVAKEFRKKQLGEHAPRFWLDECFGKNRPLAPVVGISWYEAMAFCRWWTINYAEDWARANNLEKPVQMRLPTEAEWEFAARGYEGRKYPWGNTPEPTQELTNFYKNLNQTSTVGSYPKGATTEGVLDLSGNTYEWCYDWYGKYSSKLEENPIGTKNGDSRILRGGSFWTENFSWVRGGGRGRFNPRYWGDDWGFRCARAYL